MEEGFQVHSALELEEEVLPSVPAMVVVHQTALDALHIDSGLVVVHHIDSGFAKVLHIDSGLVVVLHIDSGLVEVLHIDSGFAEILHIDWEVPRIDLIPVAVE